MTEAPARPRWPSAGRLLLAIWAVLFICGAVGELLDVGFLRSFTDVKRIFLR